MNEYLVPANAKKALFIAGFLRPVDAIVGGSGIATSVILFLIFGTQIFWQTVVMCIPAFICIFLIIPLPKYHNVMCAIADVFMFYTTRRTYKWKGWCIYDEYKD